MAVPLALLADRDVDMRRMHAEHLRQHAYQIDEAEDGRDALAKAIAHNPSLIVTAAQLPGISGVELCRLLRNDAITRVTPIIIVADHASPHDVALAEEAGASAVLVKPLPPDALEQKIAEVLAASRHLRERSRLARGRVSGQLEKSSELVDRSSRSSRAFLSHVHERGDTREPPIAPPALVCPACSRPLHYVKSHVGGVNARFPEQWDYFECGVCRTSLEYRHRTRKLRPSPTGC